MQLVDCRSREITGPTVACSRPGVTPPGQPVVHYISRSSYAAALLGGQIIDPSAPQSLVCAKTVDVSDAQVVHAAEQVAGPRHGQA